MNVAALIMAAGSGERFGGSDRKQEIPVAGRPMLAWSVLALSGSPRIRSVIVVGPADVDVRGTLPADVAAKVLVFVAGGATRQESVFNGLDRLPEGTTHVLIQDAARPCLSAALRDRVLDALATHDAVVPVVPATDTLVHERDGNVDAILDRVHVAGVQTPQGFRADLVCRAHRAARARGFRSSDDGSLVLALGEPVFAVPGERTNIKVTFREDLLIAEALLKNGVSP
jgi:2-C-methyl-D-erythritol 4-phosphate cytidylyltransferase